MGGYPRLTIGAKEEGSRSAAELLERQRSVEMFEKALKEILGHSVAPCVDRWVGCCLVASDN